MPCRTMACDGLPFSAATKPTPQASCSCRGSYRPEAGGKLMLFPSLLGEGGASRLDVDAGIPKLSDRTDCGQPCPAGLDLPNSPTGTIGWHPSDVVPGDPTPVDWSTVSAFCTV